MLNFKILSENKDNKNNQQSSNNNPQIITDLNINNKMLKDIPKFSVDYKKNNLYDDLVLDENVLINMEDDQFNFVDNNNNVNIGSMSIDDIVNIINDEINMEHTPEDKQKKIKYIFDNLIGEFKYNSDIGHVDFTPIHYKDSIFMKNLEALMFLNHSLHQFQKLDKIKNYNNKHNFKQLANTLNRFIYIILLKTLELIYVISKKLKNNPDNDELKKILLKYTIGIVFRISQYVQNYSNKMIHKIDNIDKEEHKLNDIKVLVGGKMDKLTSKIQRQNNLLKKYYKIIKNKY